MLRVLFTSLPATGHFNSMIPVANAMQVAGHQVAICSAPRFADRVEAMGFEFFPGGAESLEEMIGPNVPAYGPARTRFVQQEVFGKAAPERLIPDLERVIAAWQPDLLVRESAEYAGCLLAEKLGLPHAAVATGSSSALDDRREVFAEPLSALRQHHGLSPDAEARMMHRYLMLSLMPPRWDGDAAVPSTLHHFRYENPAGPARRCPAG